MVSRKTESTGSTPYKIRKERANKNGREYSRYVVDFGKDKSGRRVRRVFTSEAKAQFAIRERMDRDKVQASKEAILKNMIGTLPKTFPK